MELIKVIQQIDLNPTQLPVHNKKQNIRKVVIATFNTLYYKVKDDEVLIVRFFSH